MSEGSSWQLGEGLVGGSEDREWTLGREVVNERTSLEGSDERRKVWGGDSEFNDVL